MSASYAANERKGVALAAPFSRMRYVAYLRRSVRKETEYGLDAQEEAVMRWAAYKSGTVELVRVIREDDASGASDPGEREGLADALRAVERGWADGIVVARFDRLARSVYHFAAILQQSHAAGWQLVCLDPELDTSTPGGKALAHMLAVFAEFERDLFIERMRAGRQAKARRGGYVGGPAPFGQRVENGALVTAPEDAIVVERIRELRAGGSTWRAIAEALNRYGTPTARGGMWHPMTVRRIALRGVRPPPRGP